MVVRCIICGTFNELYSFHRFPKNKKKLWQWLNACDLKETDYKSSWRICSKHFRDIDFDPSCWPKRVLLSSAVPAPSKQRKVIKTPVKSEVKTDADIVISTPVVQPTTKVRHLKKGAVPSQKIPVRKHGQTPQPVTEHNTDSIADKERTIDKAPRNKCVVSSCQNYKGDAGIEFFSVTKERCNSWKIAVNTGPAKNTSNDYFICSQHFTPDLFIKLDNQTILKSLAVPTLKLEPPKVVAQPQVTLIVPGGQTQGAPMVTLPKHRPLLPRPPVIRLEPVSAKDLDPASGSAILVPLVINDVGVSGTKQIVGSIMLPKNPEPVKQYGAPVLNAPQPAVKQLPKLEFQCRTCLEVSDIKSSHSMEKTILNRRIKDIILRFIPQMVTLPILPETICKNCYQVLEVFIRFIERCVSVEKTLSNISSGIKGSNNTNGAQKTAFQKPKGHTATHNNTITFSNDFTIDSDYSEIIHIPNDDADNNFLKETTVFNEVSKDHSYSHSVPDFDFSDDDMDFSMLRNVQETYKVKVRSSVPYNISTIRDYDDMDGVSGMCKPNYRKEAIEVPVINSVDHVSLRQHDNVVSTLPPQNFAEMLRDLAKNDVAVLQLNVPYKFATPGLGKRVLLLGQRDSLCPSCDGRFPNKQALASHFKATHPNDQPPSDPKPEKFEEVIRSKYKHVCHVCEIRFHLLSKLRKHMQTEHKDFKPYQCPKCEKGFRVYHHFKKHVNDFKGLDNCNYRKCDICQQVIPKDLYFDHKKTHRNVICEKCGKFFYSASHLARHESKHREKRKKPPGDKVLCPICGKLIASAQSLRIHMQTHETPGHYMCDKCPKIFITQLRLRNHIRSVHTSVKRQYECPECKKMLGSREALKTHVNLKHTHEVIHKCHICEETFLRGDYLRRHLKKHEVFGSSSRTVTRRPTYKKCVARCKFCDKVFRNVHMLRQHIIIAHVVHKRYKCKYCGITLANQTNKYRHEKRHRDPNFELSCSICWRRLPSKEELELHYEKHEQNRKYKCGLCGESLPSKYYFQHHMSEKHISPEEVEREKTTVLRDGLEEYMLKREEFEVHEAVDSIVQDM